jgi:filamentous hemagglutinin family protein
VKKSRVRLGQLTIIAASIQLIFADAPALANPTGPQVISGTASIQRPDARTLSVTNSPGTIINWQGFSIGAGELTRFIQQSSSSAVLNRVVGADISQIYGQLLSNGRVFLINPSGIVIGPGAMIDTAGFVASTLNMLDGDFLAGKLKFQGDASSGSIINQGWIRTGYGGQVILVAPQIENSGLIHTPGGEILLAAGKSLTVTSLDLEGVQFEVQAPTDSVLNVGKLLADGGAVGVFAGSLRHSGEIRANALVYDEAGRIVLKAQNDIQLTAGSITSADGKIGGDITLHSSGGLTRVAGTVSAQGSAGHGGDLKALGDRVAVVENAVLNASGSAGGGQILVGGDFQGTNASIQNSTNTIVGAGATLRADATRSGDGGRIIVWSDDKAQFYGSLSAQGGPDGGNGGFAEVSGKQNLVFAGSANLGAPNGSMGSLLLDPLDLFVFNDGGVIPSITDESTDFPSNAATVSPATLAGITGNVSLFASRYMRISDAIDFTATPGKGLTAQVGTYTVPALPDPLALSTGTIFNELEIGANISTAGGAVSLIAPTIQSVATSLISTGGGAISLNTSGSTITAFQLSLDAGSGAVTANSGSFIQLNSAAGGSFSAMAPSSISTGAITTAGGAVALTSTGSSISTGNITPGGGNVSLTGSGGVFTGTVDTSGSVVLSASSGSIFSTVNNASSLTANAAFGTFINSTTDINVDTVNAGFGTASLSAFGGSILATSPSSQVTGFDVMLSSTDTGTGGGIGTAATALNVDVQRDLTFTTNAGFNVLLNGIGPNRLFVDLNPAHATTGTYMGTMLKQGGGLTLNANADTSTVTLNDLSITSGFDQFSSFIRFRVPNGALVADSVVVPAGNTVSSFQLPVQLIASGNLTLNSYDRASGGLANQTTISSSGGTVTLGAVNASNDNVTVSSSGNTTVSSLITTGNVNMTSSSGSVLAQATNAGLEISAGGALSISAAGIGTIDRLDLAGSTVSLTTQGGGAIGGTNSVIANTQNLTVNATNGSTFDVDTGPLVLTNLSVTANPTSVGGGLAQVTTDGTLYNFNDDAINTLFTFNPTVAAGQFAGGALSFTSTTGDISLGNTSLGTGSLILSTNSGSILGGANVTANDVTLNAATTIAAGAITATGGIALHGRNSVTAGTLNASGQIQIDGCFNFCGSPAITVGAVTGGGNVTLSAGGLLTVGGPIIGGSGSTITLNSGGITPFQFTKIDAGATGTVNITSSSGITQTVDTPPPLDIVGIRAQTVSLSATNGPIHNSADLNNQLDLIGVTSLAVNTGGTAEFNANGSTLSSLNITKSDCVDCAPFTLANLGSGQSLTIGDSPSDMMLTVNSPTTPLNFSLNYTVGDIVLDGVGINTSGGNVFLQSSGLFNGTTGGITTGGGGATLQAFGGGITTGTINTSGGALSAQTFCAGCNIDVSGNLTAGAGTVFLGASSGGNVAGSGAITSGTSVTVTASNGEIGTTVTPLEITSPSVTLNANRGGSATGNEGLVTATLTGTSALNLTGAHGFAVASNTDFSTLFVSTRGTGTGVVTLTAPGQTFNFARPTNDLFGAVPNLFQVVSVGGTPVTNATFSVSDGTLLVAAPGTINATNLTLSSTNGADISLQGTATNPLNLINTNQTFSASGATTADLLIRGNVTLAASSTQLFSANGNITLNADAGGGGAVTITAPNQTFTTSGGSSKIELLGGAAAGEKVTVTATNAQTVNAFSSSADSFKLKGGSGADASVTFSHSGTGFQDFEISNGTITVEGGSGLNAFAKIEETGTNQQEICRVTPFFGCVPVGSIRILGGTGSGAYAELTADGSQRVLFSNALTVQGGTGDGAYALLQAGTTQQIFGGSSLTVTAGGAGQTSEPFVAVPGASAIIEGHNQTITLSGAITLNGGAGTAGNTSDALLRNPSGNQTVSGSSITLNGGHTQSTTGILNLGTGFQTISGNGGILLRSDPNLPPAHADSFVLIQNMGTGNQTFTGRLTLLNSGLGSVAVTTPGNQTITANSGGVSLTTSNSGSTSVTAGGSQTIRAEFVEVLTAVGSTGDATLSATGDQYIRTTNENVNGESLVVAALGSGTAKIESGASQLLEIGYPTMMQGGAGSGVLAVGQANGVDAAGNSLVQAVDQNVFTGSILVQGPSGAGATSKLSATNTQTISTLLGGIEVFGGTGDNSLATIDPLIQTILVNGSVVLEGGSGPGANADASIVSSGPQTIFATNGDISLTGGQTTGSDAIISNLGAQQGCSLLSFLCGQPQTLVASGSIILTQPLGSALIAGGLSSNSTGAGAFLSADVTQQTLANMDELLFAFDALAPGIEEPDVTPRVPICR